MVVRTILRHAAQNRVQLAATPTLVQRECQVLAEDPATRRVGAPQMLLTHTGRCYAAMRHTGVAELPLKR